jgi:hypothetical protein
MFFAANPRFAGLHRDSGLSSEADAGEKAHRIRRMDTKLCNQDEHTKSTASHCIECEHGVGARAT